MTMRRAGRIASVSLVAVTATLFVASVALAGTFSEMKVDGHYVPLSGNCNLYDGVPAEGIYAPAVPYDADIDWQLDSSSWHDTTSWGDATGRVHFSFTMNESPTGSSVLTVRAYESQTSPYYWFWDCHQ